MASRIFMLVQTQAKDTFRQGAVFDQAKVVARPAGRRHLSRSVGDSVGFSGYQCNGTGSDG